MFSSFPRQVFGSFFGVEDGSDESGIIVLVGGVYDRDWALEDVLIGKVELLGIAIMGLVGRYSECMRDDSCGWAFEDLVPADMCVTTSEDVVSPAHLDGFSWSVGSVPLAMPLEGVPGIDPDFLAVREYEIESDPPVSVGATLEGHEPLKWVTDPAPDIVVPADQVEPWDLFDEVLSDTEGVPGRGSLLGIEGRESSDPVVLHVPDVACEEPTGAVDDINMLEEPLDVGPVIIDMRVPEVGNTDGTVNLDLDFDQLIELLGAVLDPEAASSIGDEFLDGDLTIRTLNDFKWSLIQAFLLAFGSPVPECSLGDTC